ncbi:MAG: DNA-binding protein [Microbacteriaceae bacterium]|jgi:hypothetical protein|nr:DNA-binding protein [Microbacteriaceae bacterium]
MIVIIADRVDSRGSDDFIAAVVQSLNSQLGGHLLLPADRTAGDEIQLLVDGGQTAVDALLLLTRSGRWSVGLGVGDARQPLGASIRESTGEAFAAARSAVERAKKKGTRFAVGAVPRHPLAPDLEALADLLLVIRGRRSEQGWEVRDLVARGLTQAEAASRIGITPQSASKRARAADLRTEDAAIGPLSRLVGTLDATVSTPVIDTRPVRMPRAMANEQDS